MKIKPTNALSVAIMVAVIAILVCAIILTLYSQFGLFGNNPTKNESYVLCLSVNEDTFEQNETVYLYKSREKLGTVAAVENGSIYVNIKGFYKDDVFFLNGSQPIELDKSIYIMNNCVEAIVLAIT